MKYFLLLILLISIPLNSYAFSPCSWELEVTYPDKEVKMYRFSKGVQQVTINNSKWKCSAAVEGSDSEKSNSGTVELTCNRGEAKFLSRMVCMKLMHEGEPIEMMDSAFWELFDGNKSIKLQLKSK